MQNPIPTWQTCTCYACQQIAVQEKKYKENTEAEYARFANMDLSSENAPIAEIVVEKYNPLPSAIELVFNNVRVEMYDRICKEIEENKNTPNENSYK